MGLVSANEVVLMIIGRLLVEDDVIEVSLVMTLGLEVEDVPDTGLAALVSDGLIGFILIRF